MVDSKSLEKLAMIGFQTCFNYQCPETKCGVQLGVVSEKLTVPTDRGRRKLNVVTDGATGKRSAVPERASEATIYL
jgi:hypothetical protein